MGSGQMGLGDEVEVHTLVLICVRDVSVALEQDEHANLRLLLGAQLQHLSCPVRAPPPAAEMFEMMRPRDTECRLHSRVRAYPRFPAEAEQPARS